MLKVEAEARFEGHGGASKITFFLKSGKIQYALIFPHKGKSIHHLKLQIVLFVCTHNINKKFCKIKKKTVLFLSRNTSQKLNRNSECRMLQITTLQQNNKKKNV